MSTSGSCIRTLLYPWYVCDSYWDVRSRPWLLLLDNLAGACNSIETRSSEKLSHAGPIGCGGLASVSSDLYTRVPNIPSAYIRISTIYFVKLTSLSMYSKIPSLHKPNSRSSNSVNSIVFIYTGRVQYFTYYRYITSVFIIWKANHFNIL